MNDANIIMTYCKSLPLDRMSMSDVASSDERKSQTLAVRRTCTQNVEPFWKY